MQNYSSDEISTIHIVAIGNLLALNNLLHDYKIHVKKANPNKGNNDTDNYHSLANG